MARVLVALVVTSLFLGAVAIAHTAGDAPPADQVGRYALSMADGVTVVLDTATGQCWRHTGIGGNWEDLGCPPRDLPSPKPSSVAGPVTLKLPEDEVSLTLHQRRTKPIPGSDDRLLLRLGDITEGQVLVAIEIKDGQELLPEQSLAEGEFVYFRVNDEPYSLYVRELRNLLIGDDFAVCEIARRIVEQGTEAENGDAADELTP